MIRDCPPSVTWPVAAGVAGAPAPALELSVAASSSLMPPMAGAGNSRDSRYSPSTVAEALSVSPAGRRSNWTRPASSVFAVWTFEPTRSSTVCPGRPLVTEPRTTRTVMLPSGRSVTGRGIPDICFGSGIWNWARTAVRPPTTHRTQRSSAFMPHLPIQPHLPAAPVTACARSSCRTSRRLRSSFRIRCRSFRARRRQRSLPPPWTSWTPTRRVAS